MGWGGCGWWRVLRDDSTWRASQALGVALEHDLDAAVQCPALRCLVRGREAAGALRFEILSPGRNVATGGGGRRRGGAAPFGTSRPATSFGNKGKPGGGGFGKGKPGKSKPGKRR